MTDESRLYSIGEAATRAGLSVHQLRAYMDMELIRPCRGDSNGRRQFDETCICRLQQIKAALTVGFRLCDIKPLFQSLVRQDSEGRSRAVDTIRYQLQDKRQALAVITALTERCLAQANGMSDTAMSQAAPNGHRHEPGRPASMMHENDSRHDPQLTCDECCSQVPAPSLSRTEVDDYVFYFCGSTCYEKWQRKHQRSRNAT